MNELRIKEVTYSQLRSFGNFQNEELGATAIVTEDQSAESVLANLRDWVNQQLNRRVELQTIENEIRLKEQQIDYLDRKFEKLQSVYTQLAKTLLLHGVEISEIPTFEYPMFDGIDIGIPF